MESKDPITFGELAERAARGAKLLDERRPLWFEEIDLGRLDMESTCDCVLGQVFTGGYLIGLEMLEIGTDEPDYGFDLRGKGEQFSSYAWGELRECWVREIKKRRKETPREVCTRYEGGMCGCSACAARADRGEF